jgi:NAD-dependent deacetylase
MRYFRNIVILTGAGISAESGVPTFRAADGLWEGHRIEDVATPEGFARDPVLVQRFYDARRAALRTVKPNAAHLALARLDDEWQGKLLIVTQNVDDLHERNGGAKRLVHMHGELLRARCAACQASVEWATALVDTPPCPGCGVAALRPDIVWFGEMPYHLEAIDRAMAQCELFVSIGTSGSVYPAAGYVDAAKQVGAHCLEINLQPSEISRFFHERRYGLAGNLVPIWVDSLLKLQQNTP